MPITDNFYIYAHRRNDTGQRFYIGKGRGGRAWRVYDRGVLWKRVANKHGYTVEIVATGLDESAAFLKEISLIAFHGRVDLRTGSLVNLTDGGEGVANPGMETRAKLSASRSGHKNPRFGKAHTEESKAKMSKKKTGTNLGGKHHNARKILCVDTGEVFNAMMDAVRWLQKNGKPNACHQNIVKACHGRIPTSCGYKWEYIDSQAITMI